MKDNHSKRSSSISLTKFRNLKITTSLGHRRFSSNQLQIHSKRSPIANNLQHPFQRKVMQISSRELVLHHKTSSAYSRRPKEDLLNNHQKVKIKQAHFLRRKQYKYYNMIGKGGFGKVWKVQHQQTGHMFAIKQISKALILAKRSLESIINQRIILANLNHKFISKMHYAFQDQSNLYIVMNLIQGGDLRYHLSKHIIFTQGEAKFMVTSIILAIEYLHQKMIIHRDIKPQNIVFDSKGYAHLTDFGISRYFRKNNKEDTSGTPGYMAPQVLFHQNHGFEVDFYAIGVIMHEIMMGKRPYDGRSREEVKQQIKNMQKIIQKKDIPDGWSIEAADFTNKLLQRKAIERLGWDGIQQVKGHPWIIDFPWADLMSGKLEAPKTRNYDYSSVKYRPTDKGTQFCRKIDQCLQKLQHKQTQNFFKGYEYNYSNSLNTIRIRQN